ncbi:MAG: hypothetical protein CMK89_00945 [Pseudomonadales bacterium]|nr:hypothetical protein [Pseudomonadales bacterium]
MNKNINQLLLGLLLVSFLFTSGCKTQEYEIVLPYKNARFIDQLPERFLIRCAELPERITLNGVPVQHLFEFADGQAIASGLDLSPYLTQGQNNLSVNPQEFGPRRFFFFDNQGPRVVITEALPTESELGNRVTIHGKLVDPSGVYALEVNGVPATLGSRNEFEVQVSPSQFYQFNTEDVYAQVDTLHYADRATVLNDIVKLDVDQATIDELVPFAQELVEEQNLAALLGSANANTLFSESVSIGLGKVVIVPEQCFRVCVPVFGCREECTPEVAIGPLNVDLISVSATLTDLEFEELEISELDLKSGSGWDGIGLDAELRNTDLGVRINSRLLSFNSEENELMDLLGINTSGLTVGFNAGINVNRLRLAADFGLEAENGDVNVSVQSINAIGLGSADSDFNLNFNLPAAIRNFGFGLAGMVADLIESGIEGARDLIVDLLLGKLVPLIANLIIDPLINELQVRLGATVNNGALLTALVGVQDLDVVDSNRMTISLMGRIGTETTELEPGDIELGVNLGFPEVLQLDDHLFPDLLGIPEQLGPAPGLAPNMLGFRFTPTTVPAADNTANLGLVVNSNIINQALLAVYEAGILSPTVPILDELSATGGYFITTMDNANTRIVLAPKSVPELSFRGGDRSGEAQSIAFLTVDYFEIHYEVRNEAGDWELSSRTSFNMEVPVQLSTDGESGLQLALINPQLDISLNTGQWFDYRLQFPPKLFFGRAIAGLIVDQINRGLSVVQLPDSLVLSYGDSSLAVMPGSVKTVGKPRHHFGLNASFDAL